MIYRRDMKKIVIMIFVLLNSICCLGMESDLSSEFLRNEKQHNLKDIQELHEGALKYLQQKLEVMQQRHRSEMLQLTDSGTKKVSRKIQKKKRALKSQHKVENNAYDQKVEDVENQYKLDRQQIEQDFDRRIQLAEEREAQQVAESEQGSVKVGNQTQVKKNNWFARRWQDAKRFVGVDDASKVVKLLQDPKAGFYNDYLKNHLDLLQKNIQGYTDQQVKRLLSRVQKREQNKKAIIDAITEVRPGLNLEKTESK